MSIYSRVLELYDSFDNSPRFSHEYLRVIVQSLKNDPDFYKEAKCTMVLAFGAYLTLDSADYGIFNMYLEGTSAKRYVFTYEPEYGVMPVRSDAMNKADAEQVSTAVIKFFLNKDVEDLPLIVNTFPELAKRALADSLTASY
jgi:hypothetical protein